MNRFGENGQNERFWAKMAIFCRFWAKIAKTRFFGQKAKMSLPYAYYAATLCKKPGQTYERILRYPRLNMVGYDGNHLFSNTFALTVILCFSLMLLLWKGYEAENWPGYSKT